MVWLMILGPNSHQEGAAGTRMLTVVKKHQPPSLPSGYAPKLTPIWVKDYWLDY